MHCKQRDTVANKELTVHLVMSEHLPKLIAATLDGEHRVTVRFSRRYPISTWPHRRFTLTTQSGRPLTIESVEPVGMRHGQSALYALDVVEPLDFTAETFRLQAGDVGSVTVQPWRVVHHSDKFYDPDVQLGATYTPHCTTFRVFAPLATGVDVVIADTVEGDAGLTSHAMQRIDKGVWEATVQGDQQGKWYAYRLQGDGFDPHAEVSDIYATCTQGRHHRSLIFDLTQTDPPGFRDSPHVVTESPADAVVYEMHVRDFTIAGNSGVEQKGKFLGLTESGTHVPNDSSIKTGIDHLVELGVTHVQLMPVQDFDNAEQEDDTYNWGYMPMHFNSPDGWYASDVTGTARIAELKQAIKAFHDRGIGVILDVVYNHTANYASFEKLVPGYYYRMTPSRRFCNGSGCGNEYHSENPMARKLIVDSVKFWVREYRVDGFRFDMMAAIDLETMKQVRAELDRIRPGLLLYGEPWVAGPTPLTPITDHCHIRGTGIGAFNDHIRDAIKGDRDGGPPGFIQVGDRVDGIRHGLMGAIHDWSVDPVDSINYFEVHDNLTVWDKLVQSVPDGSYALRKRMVRLATMIVLTSQGMVLLHSGQEFCRTKKGHSNSYNAPDSINRLDWSLKKTNADVYAYHRGMIALRKAHPVFRLRTRAEVEQRVRFEDPPHERCVVCVLDGAGLQGESAERILVLLNGRRKGTMFTLPEGRWSILADGNRAGLDGLGEVETKVIVRAHSGMVLCG